MSKKTYDHLPPRARLEAIRIDSGVNRDVTSVDSRKKKCGCAETRIVWDKDCGGFEDTNNTTVLDPCVFHSKSLERHVFDILKRLNKLEAALPK